ncbi:rhodanese-like domain-containing protein [Halobacteriota archaeon]
MKWKIVLVLMLVLSLLTVTFSGCVEDGGVTPLPVLTPTPTPSPTPTPTPTPLPSPKYVAGDIIAEGTTDEDGLPIIISYDQETDKYEVSFIFKNTDGDWAHFLNESTEWQDREFVEGHCPVIIANVDMSSITIEEQKTSPIPTSTTTPTHASFVTISASEAKQIIDSNPDIVILDVRTVEEFNEGHIKGAINMPVQELPDRLGELDKNDDIIVYCLTGVRGSRASQILANNGFNKVYNMGGGIGSWIGEGFPVVTSTPAPKPTLTPTPKPAPTPTSTTPQTSAFFVTISADEAKQLIDSNPDIVILDVRTFGEFYQEGHLKDAINIPDDEVFDRHTELDKNDDIIVYCSKGGRGEQASLILAESGFTKVYHIDGGIDAWKLKGYLIVTSNT